ncbi:hypothetical protein [Larkinella sp.]|uniref:hypothetical protein n=1 Tax=Larkinella sp. TaxID=2034517 RepID=UPI003BAC6E6D
MVLIRMPIKLGAYLGFSLFMVAGALAQTNVYLKPTVGLQTLFSDFTQRPSYGHLRKSFGNYDFWSLLVQCDINSKLRISTGVSESDIGWGYKIKAPTARAAQRTAAPIIQFPLKADFLLKENVRLGRLDKANYRYAMIFDLYGTTGLTYDWFRFDNYEGEILGLSVTDPKLDKIEIDEKLPNVLHRRGASIQAGIGFQFKSHDKDRLDIQFVYSQGLRKLVTADVDYTINQTAYFLQMAARGSAFRITASYPIRLSKRKNREG